MNSFTVEPVSLQEAYDYLGIDEPDPTVERNVTRTIKTADKILSGSIGKDYPRDDPRAAEIALIIISDLYDNRGLTASLSGNTRKLVDDMSLQLRLELRKQREVLNEHCH